MSFEIKVGKLRRMLELISAGKGSSYEFNEPTLHVTKEGIEVKEMDVSRTMMVRAQFEPEFFEEIGKPFEVTLNTNEVIPFLRKTFENVDEIVTCKLEKEKFIVSSPDEHFDEKIIHKDPVDAAMEIVDDPKYGWMAANVSFTTHIRLDPKAITKIPPSTHFIFNATKDKLTVGWKDELRSYNKTIPTEEIVIDEDVVSVIFACTRINNTIGQMDEEIWLHLGNAIPISVYQHDAEFKILYAVAPYVEEQ